MPLTPDATALAAIRLAFEQVVNLNARELAVWLQTEQSHSVGWRRPGERESIGHQSGRRIVSILGKTPPELEDVDFEHMRKVVGYVRRHLAQRPAGDVSGSRWRYSLMNWGHDPLKPPRPDQPDR